MTAKYYAILTSQGAARLANAAALGTSLNLTQMAVGDANGTLPMPDPAQTALINQRRIAPLNQLSVDPNNPEQIIAEQIIPESEGGFWIREIGLYDDDGVLVAVANCPETYKPQLQEGSGRTQTIRMVLAVSSTGAITLKIDPAVVLATRQYVDDKIIEVKANADALMAAHLSDANPHPQYPLIANALKEIADAGLVSRLFENLGLGTGAKLTAATASFTANGMVTIPVIFSGVEKALIIQWGQPTMSVSPATITFPVAFPTKCLVVICNDASTGGSGNGFVITSQDWNAYSFSARAYATGTTSENKNGAGGINYIAIGY